MSAVTPSPSRSFPEIRTAYPYIVIRVMAAVYVKKAVVFSEDQPTLITTSGPVCTVHYRGAPFTKKGLLKKAALEALLRAVEDKMKTWSFRCCVVLSQEQSIYLEHGGIRNPKSEAPSGGVQLDHVHLPKEKEGAKDA